MDSRKPQTALQKHKKDLVGLTAVLQLQYSLLELSS